ncbi:MAG TPA: hypothetical protein VG456_06370 [Candidatus Sulfopaludibacter sp.]|jgi:hypothetical protein|nr:hypothetical protein [Candidatus Sulfopaludibacter sp.]
MPPETEDRQQHRLLQKEYGSFYRAVSDIIFHHNPMELDGKHNTGDYNPEVDALLARIGEAANLDGLQSLLFDVFLTDFGENCGTRDRYEVPAAEIWKAYQRFKLQAGPIARPVPGS